MRQGGAREGGREGGMEGGSCRQIMRAEMYGGKISTLGEIYIIVNMQSARSKAYIYLHTRGVFAGEMIAEFVIPGDEGGARFGNRNEGPGFVGGGGRGEGGGICRYRTVALDAE